MTFKLAGVYGARSTMSQYLLLSSVCNGVVPKDVCEDAILILVLLAGVVVVDVSSSTLESQPELFEMQAAAGTEGGGGAVGVGFALV